MWKECTEILHTFFLPIVPFFSLVKAARAVFFYLRNTYYIYYVCFILSGMWAESYMYTNCTNFVVVSFVGIQQHDFVVPAKCGSHHNIHNTVLERAKRKRTVIEIENVLKACIRV